MKVKIKGLPREISVRRVFEVSYRSTLCLKLPVTRLQFLQTNLAAICKTLAHEKS